MIERLKGKTAVATAASLVAALGVGGIAVAQNAGSAPPANPPAKVKSAEGTTAPDRDNVQSGDQSTPDKSGPADRETNDGSGSEAPGQESNSEAPDQESGSEAAGNDGPGGHADEPGSPNADHQFQGQE